MSHISSFLSIAGRATVVTLMGVALLAPAGATTVYKSTGKFGEVTYSQLPPPAGTKYEVIELRSHGGVVDKGQMDGKVDPNEAAPPTAEEQRIAQLETRMKEQEEKANAERCQNLRSQLTNLNTGGRVYEMDDKGNRKYLDDRQMELKKEQIQQAISQYCSGKTS